MPLDVFSSDAFGVISLTDAINKMPYVPGLAGQVIDWQEQGVPTTEIMIEEREGQLLLIDPTPRGGPGHAIAKEKRKARRLSIPHYQIDDAIYADEVQNVRAFGTGDQLEAVQSKINSRLADHVLLRIDPTLEYQRLGALKGLILNADGTTLYDLFDEFDVEQLATVNFDLSPTSATGVIRTTCTGIVRSISDEIGGSAAGNWKVHAFAGNNFFDELVAAKEVRETYLNQTEASQLRTGAAYTVCRYGGITFENYRGSVGGTPFVADDECHFFPVGVPGLWRTRFAPADYNETVNTPGLPRYAKLFKMDDDKGTNIQVQANALSYCTRPRVLIKGDIASD